MPEQDDSGREPGLLPDLYERHAQSWTRQRSRTVSEGEAAWLDRFTESLAPGAAILDLGSGDGWPIGAELLRRGFSVTGLEASPTLAGLAARSLPEGRWMVGDMCTAEVEGCFDGVLAWHSFFHLTASDQQAMFPRFARLCTAGGRLMFTTGSHAGTAIGEWMGEPLHHASLNPEDYRALLARSGFEVIAHVLEDPTCGGSTVWLARRL